MYTAVFYANKQEQRRQFGSVTEARDWLKTEIKAGRIVLGEVREGERTLLMIGFQGSAPTVRTLEDR